MKYLKFLALVLAALVLASCGRKEPETTLPSATQPRPTTQPTEPTVMEYPISHYLDVVYSGQLREYYTALLEQWPEEVYNEAQRSPMGAQYRTGDPLENVGFALEDLDGDGFRELIIGAIRGREEHPLVFEIWSGATAEPQRWLSSQPGDLCFLEQNPEGHWTAAREVGTGEEPDAYYYYRLDGEPILVMGLRKNMEEEEVWHLVQQDPELPPEPIDAATAREHIESRTQRRTAPKYYPFYLYTP